MKEFVFLYPIQEYLNECIGREVIRSREGWDLCQKFNEIIEARYRQRSFGVNWVMFSNSNNLPDFSIKANEITIKPTDRILVSGVPFSIHRAFAIYPEPIDILAQLPQGVERLVIGGFHQYDCVDKLGKVAYEQGIPTIIDEDTTEIFFKGGRASLSVSLVRDTFPIDLNEIPLVLLETTIKSRLSKPWFTQI